MPAALAIRSAFSDDFTIEDAETVVEAMPTSTADMSVAQIRVMGGEVARVPVDATAFPHRRREMMVNIAAAYQDLETRPEHEAWVTMLVGKVRRGDPGAYVNFSGDTSESAVHEIYPGATWDRLVEVKSKYDPDNLFRSNHNIPPAS